MQGPYANRVVWIPGLLPRTPEDASSRFLIECEDLSIASTRNGSWWTRSLPGYPDNLSRSPSTATIAIGVSLQLAMGL